MKLKANQRPRLIEPTNEEEPAINQGIARDSDVPEVTVEQAKLVRPWPEVKAELDAKQRKTPKELVSICDDVEVLDYFRSEGAGWQARINDVLRNYVKTHPHK